RHIPHSGMPGATHAKLGAQVAQLQDSILCAHDRSDRSLGSMASRKASPNRFNANTVSRIAILGNTVSHQASRMFLKPSRIMLPQVAAGGGTPRPIKLSDASVRIAEAIHNEPNTTTSEIMLGRICTPIKRNGP